MNALVKKEIRLLFPSWAICFVLALPAWFFAGDLESVSGFGFFFVVILPFFLSPAMVVIMALDSFGREISAGTFSSLLALPISRSRIWWTKTLLLAVAMIILWVAWWFSLIHDKTLRVNFLELQNYHKFHQLFVAGVLFPIAVYSGGLWTVLLLRQVAAAFWFTLLIPTVLAIVTMSRTAKYPDAVEPALIIVLSLYSIAGFLFARWLFMRAQDVAWTGGLIALPEIRGLARFKIGSTARRTSRAGTALFVKEFQLHQSQFVLAGVLALLHVGVVLARKFGGEFTKQPVMEIILLGFWTLWMAMPLLIGCAAVAEERRLGTLETQLCFPARRRTQFVTKLFVAVLLSIFLGVVMPFLIEGTRILPDVHPKFFEEVGGLAEHFAKKSSGAAILAYGLGLANFSMPFLFVAGIAFVIVVVSFYASTFSRNTLQSLAPAVLGIIMTWVLLMGAPDIEKLSGFPLWRGWLINLIGLPVMGLTLLALMYWNFEHVVVGWRVWLRNGVVMFASVICVTGITSSIYHRTWEFFTPLEPAHGPTRLSLAQSVTLQSYYQTVAIRTADGRTWISPLTPSAPDLTTAFLGNWKLRPAFDSGNFLEGTNWANVELNDAGVIGIKTDGSLWVSENPQGKLNDGPIKSVQIGTDHDWKSVAGHFTWAFLLKTDGTLWRLGSKNRDRKKPQPTIQSLVPQRLGTNSDWASVARLSWNAVFRKVDGQTWIPISSANTNYIKLDDEISIYWAGNLDGIKSVSALQSSRMGGFQVGVGEDGTLSEILDSRQGRLRASFQKVRLGKETDWVAVAGEDQAAVTLKADGSLWKWSFPENPFAEPGSASASRLSKHSDWVAIANTFGGSMTLAADGSLWLWQLDSRYRSPSNERMALLSTSRKPQKIVNIFDAPHVP